MSSSGFEKIFNAWSLASVVSRCFGAESKQAKDAQEKFFELLNKLSDSKKLKFFEYLDEVKARIER